MRTRVAVIYGGRSGEHDVSCASGLSVLRALAGDRYETVAVGITREGRFVLPSESDVAARIAATADDTATAIDDRLAADGEEVRIVAGKDWGEAQIVSAGSSADVLAEIDVAFPVLHGPYGEDGTLQGQLEVVGVPYVGSGVLGSAVAMDKVAAKRAFRAERLPTAPFIWRSERAWQANPDVDGVLAELGTPVFVKPANLGSSVGISKVESRAELEGAIDEALRYDHVFVVEAAIVGREIECGVLGGRSPQASVPGEIVVPGGFYDYAAKYLNDSAEIVVPAELPGDVVRRIQDLAIAAFEAVGAWGLSRVDSFYAPDEDALYINEVNTMPGFTSISMFSKMWEATGVPYTEQVERLIDHAFERHDLLRRRAGLPAAKD